MKQQAAVAAPMISVAIHGERKRGCTLSTQRLTGVGQTPSRPLQ